MKRRTFVVGSAALAGGAMGGMPLWPNGNVAAASFDWKGSDFLAGGTRSIPDGTLAAPAFRAGPNCFVTAAQTLGPCHVNDVPVRHDISEGKAGLPMRIALRLVRADGCTPIENADIEIWHTDHRGIYSGRDAASLCTGNDPEALQGLAFRGRQVTDANGVATFLSTFPGSYRGRTIHVHCRILVEGRELLVSQFYFDDALTDIILGQHADYASRPPRDTRNDNDGLLPTQDSATYIFDVEKLDDGVLSASITVGVQV